jgi:cell division protein FtsW (lipid II flippase)
VAQHARPPAPAAPAPVRVEPEERRSRSTELVLLILAWIIVGAFYVLASLGAKGKMPPRLFAFLAVVILTTLAMHLAIRWLAPRASQVLLPIATLLNGIGYVEISRWNPVYAGYQAVWYLISAAGLVATLFLVRHVRDLDRYRYLTLLGAFFLLVSPLIPHFGQSINGARLWVAIGRLSFQPVEIAKILLAFFFASYFAANRELLSTPTQRIGRHQIVPPRTLLPVVFTWGLALVVLGAENDIGFAILLFVLFLSLIWVTTGLKTYVVLGLALFVGGGVAAYHLFHQVAERVSWWLDPWSVAAMNAGGRQIALGWFSLSAGGVAGTGLGLGQSGITLPFTTTDMIFAAIGEELGFIGIVIVVSLFVAFVAEGFRIAQRAHSDYVRLAATALSVTIGIQTFVIMAGVLRLLPFTGITVPFMAYGGSSLVANYIIVALLMRISDENATGPRGGEVRLLETPTET